jgi:hypothetical protein
MIKCLPRTSTELLILLELNNKESRHDPWNPAPHIICAVERGDNVFLCMERLMEYNQPPFRTVANYIDFFRQVLEVGTHPFSNSIKSIDRLLVPGSHIPPRAQHHPYVLFRPRFADDGHRYRHRRVPDRAF